MKLIVIIDKFIDDREFRNYSGYWLEKLGYKNIEFEDPTLSDDDPKNDNDINATKRRKEYTIQTFLKKEEDKNKKLTKREVKETLEDMEKEEVENGIIITNVEVDDDFKEYATENSIEIIDRSSFTEEL